ncbi:efflux RND transporter permease subunit [Candidatus Nitrotoga arctica]|uniref:Cobalt-zinc-cadmium resistance protein CzcA Cation efflux system protein CusA n=1 Tax=Candidatus Nitrotoga arctica TaxID=453162 RepID=A0ABM8YYC9_9PROT|nr:CusA/CzcA family heavy metal efflux RND transporter [Candidatus Nitrotoga arctica]CAG9932575.1 Cobalt-zinc-cadmium resistance protein CzcA; Cation efflux system protein CusA [Candidatus Nitrotoga arctica]
MLEKLITFALQQRMFVLAGTCVLMIAGWQAIENLPIEAFPDVQDVQVQIVTQALGQAPEEVERSITLPIEREMSGVPRMTQLRSVSITGLSVITLTFSDRTDDYFARHQVLEKLQNISLPPGVQPSLAPLTNAVGEVYRYVLEVPKDMSPNEVRALQDWVLRPALRQVPGVADVVSFGGTVKEYQVHINPFLLRKFNVTLDQVAQALSINSNNGGGGVLKRGDEALVVRSIGLFKTTGDIARVVIMAKDGKTVLVSDVGEVAIGERPRSGIVAFNDYDNVVQGIVQMTKGQNATRIVEALKIRIAQLTPKLPPGVKIVPYYDRTDLVRHAVRTVSENLIVGAILVIAILILFLRNWYAALAVAVIIPLAMLFAFILLDHGGVSANLISLGAVDFGIIIDSAVVLIEALMVKLALAKADALPQHQTYGWRLHLIKQTSIEMGHPILFSKAIIILAFLPIFTFQRVEGKIFTPVALTLTFALIGAILLTLTLLPTLLSYAVKNKDLAEKHSDWMHKLQEHYRNLLLWAGNRRKSIVAASTIVLAITLMAVPFLGSEFLPKLDEGNIWLTISLPPATALDKTKDVERQVRAILNSYPEVNNVTTQVGRPDDGTDPKGPNNLEIMADLNPHDTWHFVDKEALIADMTKKIRAIPGVPTNFSQVIQDNVEEALSGVKGEISVKIFGSDLEILEDKSEQVAHILNGIRGAADVAAIKVGGQTELNITLDRNRMARYGINVNDVNNTIKIAMAGSTVNIFYEESRRFDVTLRLDKPYRDAVDDLADLPITLPAGGTLPLGSIAEIAVRQGAARVGREAGGRLVAVKANLLGRDQGSFVDEAMAKVNAQVKLPPGYSMTWGGQFENQQRAIKRLKIIVPLSILMIFILLFWAFRSMRKALLVILMVPFTLIGGIAGLGFAGLHLSVSAAVGFIAVAGISVQNGVIMVEQFMEGLRNGKEIYESVLEGAVARLRPILMTALMAGIGLLPAALSHGIGSETQRPFAVVIVGGIVSATLFTLLLLPLLFSVFAEETNSSQKTPGS